MPSEITKLTIPQPKWPSSSLKVKGSRTPIQSTFVVIPDAPALSIKNTKTYLNFPNEKLPLAMETNLISPRPSLVVLPRPAITSSQALRKLS